MHVIDIRNHCMVSNGSQNKVYLPC